MTVQPIHPVAGADLQDTLDKMRRPLGVLARHFGIPHPMPQPSRYDEMECGRCGHTVIRKTLWDDPRYRRVDPVIDDPTVYDRYCPKCQWVGAIFVRKD